MIPSLKFYSAGHFTSGGEWRHPVTARKTWEFVYMIKGVAYMYTGGTCFTASEGDVFVLPPDEEHGGTDYSDGCVSFIWMHFLVSDPSTMTYLESLPRVLHSVESTPIPTLARTILHKSGVSFYSGELLDVTSALFVMEYFTFAGEHSEKEGRELIERVREWIRINSDKQLTVDAVANEFGYNADYLSALFRRKTGESLKAAINRMRMNMLRSELLTTDTPLKSIAMNFGFQDYKAFLKFFTYHEGMTPTEYRETCYMTRRNNK